MLTIAIAFRSSFFFRHVRFELLPSAARIVLMPDHVHHHEGGLMNDTKHYFAHGKTSPEKRRVAGRWADAREG